MSRFCLIVVFAFGLIIFLTACNEDEVDGDTADGDASDSDELTDGDTTDDDTADGDTTDSDAIDGDVIDEDSTDGDTVDGDVLDGDIAEGEADDDATEETWTDPASGLTWPVGPASDLMNWDDAKTYCENWSLAGGGWRMPSISELRTLIRGCAGTVTGGSCGVMDLCLAPSCQGESCSGCVNSEEPYSGCFGAEEVYHGECALLWSSSVVADVDDYVWLVTFDKGAVLFDYIVYSRSVRCVR